MWRGVMVPKMERKGRFRKMPFRFPSKGSRVRVPQSAPLTPPRIGFARKNKAFPRVRVFTPVTSKYPLVPRRMPSWWQRRGQLPNSPGRHWAGFPGSVDACRSYAAPLELCPLPVFQGEALLILIGWRSGFDSRRSPSWERSLTVGRRHNRKSGCNSQAGTPARLKVRTPAAFFKGEALPQLSPSLNPYKESHHVSRDRNMLTMRRIGRWVFRSLVRRHSATARTLHLLRCGAADRPRHSHAAGRAFGCRSNNNARIDWAHITLNPRAGRPPVFQQKETYEKRIYRYRGHSGSDRIGHPSALCLWLGREYHQAGECRILPLLHAHSPNHRDLRGPFGRRSRILLNPSQGLGPLSGQAARMDVRTSWALTSREVEGVKVPGVVVYAHTAQANHKLASIPALSFSLPLTQQEVTWK